MKSSIRARLLLGLLTLVAVMALLAGIITYRRMLAETSALFDYQLRQMALSLRDQAAIGAGVVLPSHPGGGDYVIQIWNPFGTRTYMSRPGLPFLNHATLGYENMTLQGERWRVYSLETEVGVIQVAQPWSVREQLAGAAALRVLAPLVLLLLLLAAAVVWIVSSGLAPLARLAREVQQRDVHSLKPIEAPELPSEAVPLIEELNRLLARLGAAFSKQRAFVADAAHELRSPLTALSLQIQLLDRAPDEPARAEARARLGRAIERAIHLVAQLLTLARNEPEGTPAPLSPLPLEPSVREGVADVQPLASERGIALSVELAAPVWVRGDAEALRILVRNLVDNAVRYTPRDGKVRVRVTTQGTGSAERACLSIEDTGPGIPAAERERVFDRFYRRADAGAGGTGLGLAIVKTIAERHGAAITLGEADPHGLGVHISLPAAPAAASGLEIQAH